ncbi:MAG: hypothetical protein JO115_01810 [Pseudonocardiales bacterium]|nr:hypothetical protein [Pseudonocardiales bacterium]
MTDSPDLAAAKRLLDTAKCEGFAFHRIAPGPDGPLRGVRKTPSGSTRSTWPGSGSPTPATPSAGAAHR